MSSIQLWLKPEIVLHGVVCAHPKLNFSYLKKVLAYAKSKSDDGGYPYLSWPIWKHMAVNKMLLSEELAWAYFNLFYTLTDKDRSHWLQLSEYQQSCFENGRPETYKNKMKVSTLQFLVFLYIQQACKLTKRKSMLGEDWPGKSPRSRTKQDRDSKLSNDRQYLDFVLSYVGQLLDILSESKINSENSKLTTEVIKALSPFILGRIIGQSNVLKLHEIAKKDLCKADNGYCIETNTFLKSEFLSWLVKNLVHNPCDVQSCIEKGHKLKWVQPDLSNSKNNKHKICYNPSLGFGCSKTVAFHNVQENTVAQQCSILRRSNIMFDNCHKSFFYILSPLKCVSIECCTDTTFVFGPVGTSIKILDCKNITIIAPCRLCIVCDSVNVTLHLSTPNQPVVVQDNLAEKMKSTITLGPYNTFYSNLGSHLVEVGLSISPDTNQWNNAAVVGVDSKNIRKTEGASEESVEKNFKIMPVEDFYFFSIPFKSKKCDNEDMIETTEIPWKLPTIYEKEVKRKQTAITKWKKAFKELKLSKDQRKMFQEMIESKFDEWVSKTGNKKHLDALRVKH